MIYILGNGMSALIIAACLEYLNKDFVILSQKKINAIPHIMYLNIKNEKNKKLYFDIFNIDDEKKYCKNIKIGFLFNKKIYSTITDEFKSNYLEKQNRSENITSMSEKENNFLAIRLDLVFNDLNLKYKNKIKIVNFKDYDFSNSIVYDTVNEFKIDNIFHNEYLVRNTNFDMEGFDIVYDCNKSSKVKRYSKEYLEYIVKPNENAIQIKNYYYEPKVYIEYNLKNNSKHIYIGRYSTKTQTKQEDIINYILNYE